MEVGATGVAGVAVVGIHVRGVVCRGSYWRTGNGLCGGSGRGALASHRLGCVRKPILYNMYLNRL
jgi:hypothetical protein